MGGIPLILLLRLGRGMSGSLLLQATRVFPAFGREAVVSLLWLSGLGT